MTNEELMHYGILGMHWGVRRYQNPDGTLTEAGKRRLKTTAKASSVASKVIETGRKIKKNSLTERAKNMSDAELQAQISRLELEKKYKELSSGNITKGENFIENLMIVAGTTAITSFISTLAKDSGKAAAVAAVMGVTSAEVAKAVYAKK